MVGQLLAQLKPGFGSVLQFRNNQHGRNAWSMKYRLQMEKQKLISLTKIQELPKRSVQENIFSLYMTTLIYVRVNYLKRRLFARYISKNLRRFFYTKDFCSLNIHGLYLYNTQGFIANKYL